MEVGVQAFAYVIRDGLDLANLCRVNDRIRVRDRGFVCSGFDGRADRDRPSARVDEPIDFFPGPTFNRLDRSFEIFAGHTLDANTSIWEQPSAPPLLSPMNQEEKHSARSIYRSRRASGGTGRRAGLRIQWGDPSEFESLLAQTVVPRAPTRHAEVAQW